MVFRIALLLYQVTFPLIALLAAPAWLLKMVRRGGWGSGLPERVGLFQKEAEFERQGGIYVHAVSVGEVLLALKLIETWREDAEDHFILVPTTTTGMAVAREKAPRDVRVIYAPIDFWCITRSVLKRFAPRAIVLIESELWPNLILQAQQLKIPIGVVNARLSPRSEARLRKLSTLVRPLVSRLDPIGIPEEEDRERWLAIGAQASAIHLTGNLKFDSQGASPPCQRPAFAEMISAFGRDRPVVMAVSTFSGEDEWLASAIIAAGSLILPIIVPRHAERRDQAALAITAATGREVIRRSAFLEPEGSEVFLVDSTGELRDWTAHADLVIIGKSFLSKGGQNPGEAIQAGVPVICGPHMANFEPLVSELAEHGGILKVTTNDELVAAIQSCLADPTQQIAAARLVTEKHHGSLARTIALF